MAENISEMHEDEDYHEEAPLLPRIVVEEAPEPTEFVLPAEESILAFTHHHRTKLVKVLSKSISGPDGMIDPDMMRVMLQTLDGMDRQTLTRVKVKADKENAAGVAQINAGVLAELLHRVPMGLPPLSGVLEHRAMPELPDGLELPALTEGETDLVVAQDNYTNFMARLNPEE